MTYIPNGVCCRKITFDVEDGCIYNVRFSGGCPGNGQAVAKLIEGEDIILVMKRLRGIRCANKGTSCADQLVKAIENIEI